MQDNSEGKEIEYELLVEKSSKLLRLGYEAELEENPETKKQLMKKYEEYKEEVLAIKEYYVGYMEIYLAPLDWEYVQMFTEQRKIWKKCRTASAEELEALEARSAELSIEMKKKATGDRNIERFCKY